MTVSLCQFQSSVSFLFNAHSLVFYLVSYFPSLSPAMGQHDTISFQFSVLSFQFSVFQGSVCSVQFSVFISVFSFQFSAFSFQFWRAAVQHSSQVLLQEATGTINFLSLFPAGHLWVVVPAPHDREACIRQALEFKFKDYLALVLLVADYSDYRGAPIVSRLRRLRPIPVLIPLYETPKFASCSPPSDGGQSPGSVRELQK